jgi:hypothetical protein
LTDAKNAAYRKRHRTDFGIFTKAARVSKVDPIEYGAGALDGVELLWHQRSDVTAGRQARKVEIAEAHRLRRSLASPD